MAKLVALLVLAFVAAAFAAPSPVAAPGPLAYPGPNPAPEAKANPAVYYAGYPYGAWPYAGYYGYPYTYVVG